MSHPDFQRVAIVGAGAIGGWMGVHLARAGAELSVLARGDTLSMLQQIGLQLHQGGELHTVPVKASNDAMALGVQDLVVISVKSPALASVAQQVGPLIGPNTVVLTAMNGVPWWFFEGLGGALKHHNPIEFFMGNAGTAMRPLTAALALLVIGGSRRVPGGVGLAAEAAHGSCTDLPPVRKR